MASDVSESWRIGFDARSITSETECSLYCWQWLSKYSTNRSATREILIAQFEWIFAAFVAKPQQSTIEAAIDFIVDTDIQRIARSKYATTVPQYKCQLWNAIVDFGAQFERDTDSARLQCKAFFATGTFVRQQYSGRRKYLYKWQNNYTERRQQHNGKHSHDSIDLSNAPCDAIVQSAIDCLRKSASDNACTSLRSSGYNIRSHLRSSHKCLWRTTDQIDGWAWAIWIDIWSIHGIATIHAAFNTLAIGSIARKFKQSRTKVPIYFVADCNCRWKWYAIIDASLEHSNSACSERIKYFIDTTRIPIYSNNSIVGRQYDCVRCGSRRFVSFGWRGQDIGWLREKGR